ncbi:hypothetical protein [Winogradskyella rapida]|uniref:Uncharacterized protein n=1 Tax=Winogradskyella rapida TaxID=549701 RepID=A0ABW3KSS6_9FLAO
MQKSKRLNFLNSFLKLYGVEKIELIKEKVDSISGIAIYDESNPEEIQEFIWHKSENQVPDTELCILIDKIVAKKMHTGDLIHDNKISNLEFKEFNNLKRDKLIELLYDVKIIMIDNGKETDSYFVHS